MHIRKAEPSDLQKIVLLKESDQATIFQNRIKEMSEGKALYLVADDNDEVVGHAFLKLYGTPSIPQYPSVDDLAVRIDQRRKGIGTQLLQKCEEIVKEKGFTQMGIQVNPDPTCPAHIMYLKYGFTDVGNRPYVDGVYNGVKDWVVDMVKQIA